LPLKSRPHLSHQIQSYKSSEKLTRHFCGKCGTHLFVETTEGAWSLCAGAVDSIEGVDTPVDQLQSYTQHEFVGDTLDGGLAVCLTGAGGKAIPYNLQGPDGEKVDRPLEFWLAQPDKGEANTAGSARPRPESRPESLAAKCHCGGVQYRVFPPSDTSKDLSAPWPDLIVPHSAHSANPDDVKWWLCDGGTRYLAGTCACRSCRLGLGTPIQTWAFIPAENLKLSDGASFSYELGTLRQYESSPGTYREFCSRCGATAFWHCEERPKLVDVSVGLLRALEGSRAETWLSWNTDRVSFKEDAFDRLLVQHLETGLKCLDGR
jgi:hypothetical protein